MGRYKSYTTSPKPLHNIPPRTRQRILQRLLRPKTQFNSTINLQKSDSLSSVVHDETDVEVNEVPEGEMSDSENPIEDENRGQFESSGFESDTDSCDEFIGDNSVEKSPLYPEARITEDQSKLLLLAFVHRYNLTTQAVEDLLELVEFHTPVGTKLVKTKYLVKKFIGSGASNLEQRHYYCKSCESYLGCNSKENICEECAVKNIPVKNSDENFFFVYDPEERIIELLETQISNILPSLRTRPESIEDIVDGECYKQLSKSSDDFTCAMNTDGISPFKSSNYQLWPFFISLNELPYRIRRQNSILVALWFGTKKPNFRTFLKPLVDIFNRLGLLGLKWNCNGNIVTSKILFPILVCDSPARSCVQGITHHNGSYSCNYCLHTGETLWISENSHKSIIPYIKTPHPPRTKDNFIQHLKDLRKELGSNGSAKSIYGIQEASQLILLKSFDICEGPVYDYMHSELLGVLRYFTLAWFDSKNNQEPCYIGSKMKILDVQCTRVAVPSCFRRVMRKISEMSHWKASEWKIWLMVGPILLKNQLPEHYRLHFSKFCQSIILLLQESCTFETTYQAEKLIQQFAASVEGLYGKRFLTFNLHITLHAPKVVRRWGPLWCYSTFQFENENGRLLRLFNGTRKIATELTGKLADEIAMKKRAQTIFPSNSLAKDFFDSMLNHRNFFTTAMKVQDFVLVGSSKKYFLNVEEIRHLERLKIVGAAESLFFKKAIYKSLVFDIAKSSSNRFSDYVLELDGKLYLNKGFIVINPSNAPLVLLLMRRINCVPVESAVNTFRATNIQHRPRLILPTRNISLTKYILIYGNVKNISHLCKIPNVVELD